MAQITKNIVGKKSFDYSKRGVSLSFTLNNDLQLIKDFRALLIEARKDLDKIIDNFKEE